MRVPTMAAKAVDVNTALVSMPCDARLEKMLGLTARIYAMVRNVVTPAIISVRMLCFLGSKPKSFESIVLSLLKTFLLFYLFTFLPFSLFTFRFRLRSPTSRQGRDGT